MFGNDVSYFGGGAPANYAPAFATAVTKGRGYVGLARTTERMG